MVKTVNVSSRPGVPGSTSLPDAKVSKGLPGFCFLNPMISQAGTVVKGENVDLQMISLASS
jgi:hypothetical protein